MKLYHFTRFENLINILESNKLFFSNLKYSNDPSEGLYPIEVIRDCLQKICKDEGEFKTIFRHVNANIISNENLNLYSISFTSELNSVHSRMEYGDYARGVAIEFDTDKYNEIIEKKANSNLNIKSVYYDVKCVRREIETIYKNNIEDKNFFELAKQILLVYPIVKDDLYKIENEYRICFVDGKPYMHSADDGIFGQDCETFHYYLNVGSLIKLGVIKTVYLGSNLTLYEEDFLKKRIEKLELELELTTRYIPITNRLQ